MKRVKEFLKNYWDGKSPLLLGYSGGPDSKALLYALFESVGPHLHVAHIDHGWREESRAEAEQIREEIFDLKLPFYTTRLNISFKKNKEEMAREARLHFFLSLFEKVPFQALVLGHHADDLAETALKRLFEGAPLSHLGGMEGSSVLYRNNLKNRDFGKEAPQNFDSEQATIAGRQGASENQNFEVKPTKAKTDSSSCCGIGSMPVWRPLLKMKKQELLSFLEERQLKPFFDSTNSDPTYLRARLRGETIPFLCDSFGKSVRDNLCLLSERSYELNRYLDRKTAGFKVVEGSWGFAICCEGFERLERRHLLQKVARERDLVLTRTVLEPILDWIDDLGERRKLFFQSRWIVSGRGWVIFLLSDENRTFTNLNTCLSCIYK